MTRHPQNFEQSLRVSLADVDSVQIHFSAYIRWMDLGVTGLLERLGRPLQTLLASGQALPLVDVHCRYIVAIDLGDNVDAVSSITNVGETSCTMTHRFSVEGREVAVGETTHVWTEKVDGVPRPTQVPDWIKDASARG